MNDKPISRQMIPFLSLESGLNPASIVVHHVNELRRQFAPCEEMRVRAIVDNDSLVIEAEI